MTWKVKFTHSTMGSRESSIHIRRGTEIYRHPKGRFVTLEFHGRIGKFRESFRPNELMKVSV